MGWIGSIASIGSYQGSFDDPDGNLGDFFGNAVAVSSTGKVLVVGSDRNREGVGKAYIYVKGLTSFGSPTTLVDPASSTLSCFACSVAVSGNTVAVGSPDQFGTGGGEVYLYVKGPAGWPHTPTVTIPDPGTSPTTASAIRSP